MPWHIRSLIIIFLLSLVTYVYIGWRLSRAISILFSISPLFVRSIIILVIFFFNILPIFVLLCYWTGNQGHLFLFKDQLHWLDFLLTFPYWLGLIVVIEILPYFLSLDILGLFIRIVGVDYQSNWMKFQAILNIGLISFFLLYVGIRSYWDTYHVRITSYQVPIKNLPGALQDLSLTLIGDIQLDRYTQKKKITQFKNQLQTIKSDLFMSAGDIITNGKDFIPPAIQLLCDIKASEERIACMGDHDFWADPNYISHALQNCGWTFLRNQHHVIPYKGHKILVTGVTYIYSKKISTQQLMSLLANTPDADLKILLVHQPGKLVIEMAAKFGYHLLLAGHTHGGQFVFKPFGISLTPSQFENEIYRGYDRYGDLQVVITNGIGLTLAPLRYHAPAEITKIVLIKNN